MPDLGGALMTWCPRVSKFGLVLLLLAAPLAPALAAPQIEAKSFTIPSPEPGIDLFLRNKRQ